MEQESFADEEVARLMNETFVNIKVDREERPDIDQVYMLACQALTGTGGWPLNLILTPDGRPFFAATYIPKESRFGRIGLLELIPQIREVWHNRRQEVLKAASQVVSLIKELAQTGRGQEPGEGVLQEAYRRLKASFDPVYGGFGSAPKFPVPVRLIFLLRYWRRTGDHEALEMVVKTLSAMRRGGIYDQLGYGFHRYATDAQWLVPHFEKMLYDQALLALAYLEAHQATGDTSYAKVADEILTYVLRDLKASEGGFYSSEDADVEGEEGKYYLWTIEEVKEVLDRDEAELALKAFGLTPEGNFSESGIQGPMGRNILHLALPLEELSQVLGLPLPSVESKLDEIRRKLLEARGQRVRPDLDTKILADWNGLTIAALARAGRLLDRPQYLEAAERAADFILTTLRMGDGGLYHRYCDGQASIPGFLEDYAFILWGLLELYEASFKPRYLAEALKLADILLAKFRDKDGGGFYQVSLDEHPPLVRWKEFYDDAIPAGNSVAAYTLLRLARLTGRVDYEKVASEIFQAATGLLERAPEAATFLLTAYDMSLGPSYEVVVVGERGEPAVEEALRALSRIYRPGLVVLHRPPEPGELGGLVPYMVGLKPIGRGATIYLCSNFRCDRPTTNLQEVLERLEVGGED
jgi:hypothetical protein